MNKYDIAAFVWPAYTGDEKRARIFWPEGIGEWETVKNSKPKQCGYYWSRKPVWGYVNEADPYVMSMQIDAAADHGVNVFIYDWYWYDGRPFLENCLKDGFLKAPNNKRMKFYIMWANHDVNYLWDKRNAGKAESTIWTGAVDRNQFEKIGRRWIDEYFCCDNYYMIDGKPVICLYELYNLVCGLGGVENTADALCWLDNEAKKAGYNGVHFQYICRSGNNEGLDGIESGTMTTNAEVLHKIGVSSVTNYQFVSMTDIDRDYLEILEDVKKVWEDNGNVYKMPYYPHVAIGWDNNLRFEQFKEGIIKNNTPENFEKALRAVKEFADEKGVSLITINSWNEWTEGSYLQPDDLYGYGYLEAVKKVFCEE